MNDLARELTPLGEADIEWLHALVSDWQLLADLSFADLILWAPVRDDGGWLALAQMRPTTGPTSLQDDVVGTVAGPEDQRLLNIARDERRIWRESDPDWTNGVPVRTEGIPVTRAGRVIAVIERCTNLNSAGSAGPGGSPTPARTRSRPTAAWAWPPTSSARSWPWSPPGCARPMSRWTSR